ncbi:hypothetical protein KPH14_012646 [Odynerus spinipes]|uniref:Uncharacterized protein n=1 Tax=Odynerus spinipes TaxID=1348599 RepID=A0AAD9VMC2_9HYME|nr:hypothetical protein KPH14_012646 [Odynerus spinipes]
MPLERPASATNDPEHPTGWAYLDPFREHLDQLWDVPGLVVALEEAGRVLRQETINDSRGRLRDLPIGVPMSTQTPLPTSHTIATQTETSCWRTCDVSTQAGRCTDLR